MTINDFKGKGDSNSVAYEVRVVPPPRTLATKEITHHYELIEKDPSEPVKFDLEHLDLERYLVKVHGIATLRREQAAKSRTDTSLNDSRQFSELTLVAEGARYLNMKALDVKRYLGASVDGMGKIIEIVSTYNEVFYDVIIPGLFNHLWEVRSTQEINDREVVLLKAPKDADCYTFRAKPGLVITQYSSTLSKDEKSKTFHADTYCLDSKPERECFSQYYDPDSQRIRSYYPDLLAKMTDGSYQLIEVKDDNKIYDRIVKAKAKAATEVDTASNIEYIMYAGSYLMNSNVLTDTDDSDSILKLNERVPF
ncbi:hypothetical protein [Canibacter zhoujuaniae]|uniref:hypothetical protein n=1 Tax=Canibacter zhoujuaniae TaxID=2708343 RepID=UPI0014219A7F|nr:hypothetical protein [Canibacter zhoujuaniae]